MRRTVGWVRLGRRTRADHDVVRITDAREAHSDDLDARISRYLISMLIRTVCVVLVVVIDSPWRWLFAVGAVGLPYLAVVMANTGRTARKDARAPVPKPVRSALPESGSVDAPGRNEQ